MTENKIGVGGMQAAAAIAAVFLTAWGVPSARAEAPGAVGLEARGVAPWAALKNRWGLDVRDELNRPVSAARLESELKAASARAAEDTAYASSNPRARLVIRLQELLAAPGDVLKPLIGRFFAPELWALPPSGRGHRFTLPPVFCWLMLFSALAGSVCASAALSASTSCLPLVLRC